jgi:hypothetical protein
MLTGVNPLLDNVGSRAMKNALVAVTIRNEYLELLQCIFLQELGRATGKVK